MPGSRWLLRYLFVPAIGLYQAFSWGIRKAVGGWSLERKSLLFLGVALVVPIGLSFWFVLQILAERLVMQTTRQAARDYARTHIAWEHVKNMSQDSVYPSPDSTLFTQDAYAPLRKRLVENPDYSQPEFLMLDRQVEHASLAKASRPISAREKRILEDLESSFREQLAKLEVAEQNAIEAAVEQSTTEAPSQESQQTLSREELDVLFAEDEEVRAIRKSLDKLYRDDGPFFPDADELEHLLGTGLIEETPAEGWYAYYHAISFPDTCIRCHERFNISAADRIPFRAVRVLMPYGQTQVASNLTVAVMIAVAMVTVAATLLVVHWVFRRLVLNPLNHLRSVSDEISHGNISLRAQIDTGDEFNDLGDAFNRMLRNVTENQNELQTLNAELDRKVDQLAQANLNLYEANRLKSDFLANMSHELRTPLNSIIGFSDVLRDIDSLSDKQRKYANNIQSSGKVLLEMINEILDLAKIEAGKMQVTPATFDLPELVESQCAVVQPLVDEKNVDLQLELDLQMEEVFQDRAKIQQILTNLLSNAIKFTPDGGLIHVRVTMHTDTLFRLEVEDTGVGIPESDFEIIFEKFRQSDAVLRNDGLTRQFAGTGLGLSIVKELCKLLGGEIQLFSELGQGSLFRVLLPADYQSGEIRPLENSSPV